MGDLLSSAIDYFDQQSIRDRRIIFLSVKTAFERNSEIPSALQEYLDGFVNA